MSDPNTTTPGTPAPGWYPSDDTTERWWDGTKWSDATRPQQTSAPSTSSGSTPPTAKSSKNVTGITALAFAGLGFIFACIPGALVVGWILLPIGFLLGIIAVCLRGRSKWTGITAIIVAVVGTIAGILVFVNVVANAFTDSFGSGDTKIATSAPSESAAVPSSGASVDAKAGTSRENPLPFSSPIENHDWTVSLTAFNGDATADVEAANQFNTQPADGQTWVILDVTATYKGTGEGTSNFVQIDYVTADGTIVSSWNNLAAGVEPRFGQASLYAGAADTGKVAFIVPASLDGVIRVKPGMTAKDVFFKLP